MRRVGEDRMPQIFRAQRRDQRLYEMSETGVVWLITQRSRVQIPPPLPRPEADSEQGIGLWPEFCKPIL